VDHGNNDNIDINVDDAPPKNAIDKEKDSDSTRTKKRSVEQITEEDTDMPTRPSCFDHGTPCKFDEVGKYLEGAALFTIMDKQSDAIPNNRIIPPSMASNDIYIASRRSLGPANGSMIQPWSVTELLTVQISQHEPELPRLLYIGLRSCHLILFPLFVSDFFTFTRIIAPLLDNESVTHWNNAWNQKSGMLHGTVPSPWK